VNKKTKSPIPIPIEPPFENIQSLKDLHFWLPFHQGFSQSFRAAAAPSFAEKIASKTLRY